MIHLSRPDAPPAELATSPSYRLELELETRKAVGHGSIARNLGALGLGQIVTWSTTFIWALVVPRAVGPSGMALLVMYWSVSAVMTIFGGMGTKTLLVREISAHRNRAPVLIGSSFYLRAFTIAPILLVTAIYIKLGSFDGGRATVIWLAFIATVVNLFTDPVQAAFQGIERMEFLALGDVMVKTLGAAGAIVLLILGFHALAIVVYSLVLGWIVLVLYLRLIHRYIKIALRFDWPAIRGLFRESLSFWAFAVTVTIYFWIDSILLSLLAPPDQLGWYGTPTKLTSTLMFVPTIIWAVWLPRLSSAFNHSPGELKRTAQIPLEWSLVLALPVSAGAILVAQPLIGFLYGAAFAPSAPVFAVLALTVLPVYLNTGFGNVLIASKRQTQWTVVMIVAALVNFVLNLVLIPTFQTRFHSAALGAAWALVATEALILGAGLVLTHTFVAAISVGRLGRAVVATALMCVAVFGVMRYGLVAEVATGVVVFLVAALAVRLVTPEEVAFVRSSVRRALAR